MRTRTNNELRNRRGMTIIETILAMTITAMVGGVISTMMAAVSDEPASNHELEAVSSASDWHSPDCPPT